MRKRHNPPESELLKHTRTLLKERKLTLHEVSLATGIPTNWLWRLTSGESVDPGVSRVEAVFAALGGRWSDLTPRNI